LIYKTKINDKRFSISNIEEYENALDEMVKVDKGGGNYKGTLFVFSKDDKLEKVYHNRFVFSGRAFALETLFPIDRGTNETWLEELVANNSSPYARYFGVGTGTTSNGQTGPTDEGEGGTPPSQSTPTLTNRNNNSVLKENWNGASIFDFTLDNDVTTTDSRGVVSVRSRNNRTMELEMTIGSAVVSLPAYIYEVGIFLGPATTYPNTQVDDGAGWDVDDRCNQMISRIVLSKEETGDANSWVTDPLYIASGDSKTIRYVFQDI